jgi:hypothetical protein
VCTAHAIRWGLETLIPWAFATCVGVVSSLQQKPRLASWFRQQGRLVSDV